MTIWKQGQFYPELGKKIIELPYVVHPGPSDRQIKIDGFSVSQDNDGNFLNQNYTEGEQNAIHTYGTMRMVIDLFEEFIGKPILWSWQQMSEDVPLIVRIGCNDINARFLVEQKCLELDCYGTSENLIYNCRTTDLIAHETGHAIMDSIIPEWKNGDVETRGMEEAFCDLHAMFFILAQKDLCNIIIQETHGDLSKSNILSLFGVGHGFHGNPFREIRNALNDTKYNANYWNAYSYAEVLVGALYDILIDWYNDNKDRDDKVKTLFDVGEMWRESILRTFLKCNSKRSSLLEFSFLLAEILQDHRRIIKNRFKNRNVS